MYVSLHLIKSFSRRCNANTEAGDAAISYDINYSVLYNNNEVKV